MQRQTPQGDPGRLAAAVLKVLPRSHWGAARERSKRFLAEPYVEHVERLISG